MADLIPLMSEANALGNRRKLKEISREFCILHPHAYDLVKNKRGHVVRALLRPRQSLQPLSNAGESFEEPLPNVGKKIWSLRLDRNHKS